MRPILVSLFLLLAISGCEEECATPDFIVEDPESQSYWGEWRYAYSLLLCDNSAPQGGNTYVVDTVFPGETVTWREEPIPTKTVIIGNEFVVIENHETSNHCIYHGWYTETEPTQGNSKKSTFSIYMDADYAFNFTLVRFYNIGEDTARGTPGHFSHSACGTFSYQTENYYVKVN